MRLVIAIELEEGENVAAQVPFTESDLMKSPGKIAEMFAQPMIRQLLQAFEEELPADREARNRIINRGIKRSVEAFRERHKQQQLNG
jgi:hypothetical protein